MKKSETTAFCFYFFIQEDLHFVRKHIWKNLVYIVTFALPFFSRGRLLEMQYHNRLGFLTQILITMDYFFYLYISDIYLQFRGKSILIWAVNFIIKSIRKGIEILTKRLFSFYIIVFNMKFLVILIIRKSICYGKLFGSLHTSNRIYLLRNCF